MAEQFTIQDLLEARRTKQRQTSSLKKLADIANVQEAAMQVQEARQRVTLLASDVQKAVDRAAANRGSARDPKTRKARVLTESVIFDRQMALHCHSILQDHRAMLHIGSDALAEELAMISADLADRNNVVMSIGLLFRYCAALMKLGPTNTVIKPGDVLDKAFNRIARGLPLADKESWDARKVVFAAPRFVEWMWRNKFNAPQLARELRAFRKGLPISGETVRRWMRGEKSTNKAYMEALYSFSNDEIEPDWFETTQIDGRMPSDWVQAKARRRK